MPRMRPGHQILLYRRDKEWAVPTTAVPDLPAKLAQVPIFGYSDWGIVPNS